MAVGDEEVGFCLFDPFDESADRVECIAADVMPFDVAAEYRKERQCLVDQGRGVGVVQVGHEKQTIDFDGRVGVDRFVRGLEDGLKGVELGHRLGAYRRLAG
jgi:hypothetical protein